MRIFTKYILKEVAQQAMIGLVLFTFIIFMRDLSRVFELVVRNSAPIPSVAEIFLLTLPTAFTVTIPMGVLVGILIGLSRLAADSEVTAMRAGGIGASAFARVISIFAFVAFALAMANSIYLSPKSAAALANLQEELKTRQISFEVQPRVFYENFKDYVLYVQDSSASSGAAVWKDVFLADVSDPGTPKITTAETAVVLQDDPYTLRLHLKNGAQHQSVADKPEQYTISTFDETDIQIPIPQPEPRTPDRVRVAELSTAELMERSKTNPDPFVRRWNTVELHRRLALPFSCLVLALIGIPLGLSAKKGGKASGFVLTILLVMLYYFAQLAGISLSRQGKLPAEIGPWLANILFFLVGVYLLWRVDRRPLQLGWLRAVSDNFRAGIVRILKPASVPATGAPMRARSRQNLISRILGTRFPLLLDNLVLRDFLTYLGIVLMGFITLMLVFTFFELLNDIVRNRVALVTVALYLLNVAPSMVYLMTPLSVLLAVLVTFGLLEKSSEITAMKATGVSVYRIVLPILLIAGCLSVGLFFFDEFYLPQANRRQEALRNTIKGKPAQTYLRPDRKWIFGEKSTIYYYEFFDPDQNRFANISIFEFDPQTFEITRRTYANRAFWSAELNKWVFQNGWTRSLMNEEVREFRTFEVATFDRTAEAPQYFKKEARQSSEMSYAELRRYIQDLRQSGFDVVRLQVQLYKKFAFPLITFVMAVLAIPFSLSAGRKGAVTGVAVAVGIAIAYWVIAGIFEAMGNVNQLPPMLAAWAPSLIFGLSGGYLILKVRT